MIILFLQASVFSVTSVLFRLSTRLRWDAVESFFLFLLTTLSRVQKEICHSITLIFISPKVWKWNWLKNYTWVFVLCVALCKVENWLIMKSFTSCDLKNAKMYVFKYNLVATVSMKVFTQVETVVHCSKFGPPCTGVIQWRNALKSPPEICNRHY